MNEVLSILANWVTIFGLGMTIWILFSARGIRRSYLLAARGPQLIKELGASAGRVVVLLNEYDSRHVEIERELTEARADIVSLAEKTTRRLTRKLKQLERSIHDFN